MNRCKCCNSETILSKTAENGSHKLFLCTTCAEVYMLDSNGEYRRPDAYEFCSALNNRKIPKNHLNEEDEVWGTVYIASAVSMKTSCPMCAIKLLVSAISIIFHSSPAIKNEISEEQFLHDITDLLKSYSEDMKGSSNELTH